MSALKGGGAIAERAPVQCFFLEQIWYKEGEIFFSMRCARDRVYRICCFCLKK